MMVCGIYMIKNTINNKVYIGQSIHVYDRLSEHKTKLNGKYHSNSHLQHSFNKYGKDSFEFKLLKACKEKYLDRFEKLFIRIGDLTNPKKGYNKESGGNFNKHLSIETRTKISEGNKGLKRSEETRKRISESKKGHEVSEETRNKISQKRIKSEIAKGKNNPMYGISLDGEKNGMYGKTHTSKSREKISKNLSKSVNKSGYYRVTIHKREKNKQGFAYSYRWYEDGKRHELESVDIDKLKEKVLARGLEWRSMDELD